MAEEYDQVLDVVVENPGATIEEITDLARDRGVTDIDIPDPSHRRSATTTLLNSMDGTE